MGQVTMMVDSLGVFDNNGGGTVGVPPERKGTVMDVDKLMDAWAMTDDPEWVGLVAQGCFDAEMWAGTVLGEEPDADFESPDDRDEPVAATSVARLEEEVADFIQGARLLLALLVAEHDATAESIGHDFMLTRNGHGTGFWDRGYGRLGDLLADDARVYGSTCWVVDGGELVFTCG